MAIGCGAPDRVNLPATMAVSSSFTSEQTETIFAAADAWTQATGGAAKFQFFIGDGANIDFEPSNLDNHNTMGETHVAATDSATIRVDVDSIQIVLDEYEALHRTVPVLQFVAMHEIGHALGLNHVPDTLMRAYGYGGIKVDPDTLRRFCENYACAE